MNKRVLGTFVCILLLLNFSTVCGQINFKRLENLSNMTFLANSTDLPSWRVGDSWTYDIVLNGNSDSLSYFNGEIEDLMICVDDDSGNSYKLEFEGSITGEVSTEDVSGTLKDTIIEGDVLFEKSNLGIKQLNVHIQGKLIVVLVPILLDIDLTVTFNPISARTRSVMSVETPMTPATSPL